MRTKIKASRTTDEVQSSAQIVASIDDLLKEILLRLPIKSLIRFKLVSKEWHSLITNPRFCRLRNPNPNPAAGLFLHCLSYRARPWIEYVPFSGIKSGNPPLRKLKFFKDPKGIRIVHSCNGLLLCSSFQARDNNRTYYVHNPTTNKFSALPKPAVGGGISAKIDGMSLAFDPTKSPYYKVVCVRRLGLHMVGGNLYQFEVYSSETGSWIKCGEPFTTQVNFEDGIYWNGAIHWTNNGTGRDSLYFNIDNQMLGVMPIPPIGWDCINNYYFGESFDHLHYIKIVGPELHFDVYEMRRDYSEWFIKYNVDLSPVVSAYPEIIRNYIRPTSSCYYACSIFSLVRGEKEEDSFLVLQIPGIAIRYNLVYRTFETICEFAGVVAPGGLRFRGTDGFQYIESLSCVC
ncbi:hypothetical protein DH2020_048421 [Rehmannia glutinosa]|uniref:F-box domain-containing protein n=1 Tax=Rehmannia glutinosa TaxID=99300 RepID=A0ABR0U697_REHGL